MFQNGLLQLVCNEWGQISSAAGRPSASVGARCQKNVHRPERDWSLLPGHGRVARPPAHAPWRWPGPRVKASGGQPEGKAKGRRKKDASQLVSTVASRQSVMESRKAVNISLTSRNGMKEVAHCDTESPGTLRRPRACTHSVANSVSDQRTELILKVRLDLRLSMLRFCQYGKQPDTQNMTKHSVEP